MNLGSAAQILALPKDILKSTLLTEPALIWSGVSVKYDHSGTLVLFVYGYCTSVQQCYRLPSDVGSSFSYGTQALLLGFRICL